MNLVGNLLVTIVIRRRVVFGQVTINAAQEEHVDQLLIPIQMVRQKCTIITNFKINAMEPDALKLFNYDTRIVC